MVYKAVPYQNLLLVISALSLPVKNEYLYAGKEKVYGEFDVASQSGKRWKYFNSKKRLSKTSVSNT